MVLRGAGRKWGGQLGVQGADGACLASVRQQERVVLTVLDGGKEKVGGGQASPGVSVPRAGCLICGDPCS